ncbi:MAG: DUF2867 domain-containing protein [Limnohabitans sp.]|nr:DUF2867 domain-containing protein [Limnohabitans sp.]
MQTKQTTLPLNSIFQQNKNYDYIDCYQSNFETNKILKPEDIAKAFFSSAPKWIGVLFEFRNKIVSLFGLKVPEKGKNHQELLENFKGEVGEQIGLFKVFYKSDNEIVLGEDDKHLNFRISLFLNKSKITTKEITISTIVKFNNTFGKFYFLPVKPFHKIIVPVMLKGIITNLKK